MLDNNVRKCDTCGAVLIDEEFVAHKCDKRPEIEKVWFTDWGETIIFYEDGREVRLSRQNLQVHTEDILALQHFLASRDLNKHHSIIDTHFATCNKETAPPTTFPTSFAQPKNSQSLGSGGTVKSGFVKLVLSNAFWYFSCQNPFVKTVLVNTTRHLNS